MKTNMELDITKLIEKASDLVHDGRIDMAERGEVIVQELVDEDGNKFRISVVMTRVHD